jgi:hypothetical protein
MIKRLISGGQTGADQEGLFVARELGIETGGTATLGWRTEDGPAPWLAEYGLVEDDSAEYGARTDKNVRDSDGTVIFGSINEPGTRRTIYTCLRLEKPYRVNPDVEVLVGFIRLCKITILNVAGNRRSKHPEVPAHVRAVLKPALEILLNDH